MGLRDGQNKISRRDNRRARENRARREAKYASTERDNDETLAVLSGFLLPARPREEEEGRTFGRVAKIQAGAIWINKDDRMFRAKLSQPHLWKTLAPHLVVGDEVQLQGLQSEEVVVRARLPRNNVLTRIRGDASRISAFAQELHVIAANIDRAVIVASASQPPFYPGLVDRYLVLCEYGGVTPTICINKADLTKERHPIIQWYRDQLKLSVFETSATTGEGMSELAAYLKGKVSVVVGNSGVGKSTIINFLNSHLHIRTQTVSVRHEEGRHTTTSTDLYKWDEGSYIIDTPGIRNLGITNISRSALQEYFKEFAPFATLCKFGNCLHQFEPECGVRSATERQEISSYRYQSYLRMLQGLGD